MYICVRGIDFVSDIIILLLDFGTVLTVWVVFLFPHRHTVTTDYFIYLHHHNTSRLHIIITLHAYDP